MSRRRRGPEPAPVDARPARWLLFGALGLAVVLIAPPVAVVVSGKGSVSVVVMTLWPVAALVLMWRSRMTVDRDGVDFTFLGTRHVAWSDIEALVASGSGLRGPYLRVRGGRPIPLNPFWRAAGRPVPEALAPWARRKRVRIEGAVEDTGRRRPQLLLIAVLVVVGALAGIVVANVTLG